MEGNVIEHSLPVLSFLPDLLDPLYSSCTGLFLFWSDFFSLCHSSPASLSGCLVLILYTSAQIWAPPGGFARPPCIKKHPTPILALFISHFIFYFPVLTLRRGYQNFLLPTGRNTTLNPTKWFLCSSRHVLLSFFALSEIVLAAFPFLYAMWTQSWNIFLYFSNHIYKRYFGQKYFTKKPGVEVKAYSGVGGYFTVYRERSTSQLPTYFH